MSTEEITQKISRLTEEERLAVSEQVDNFLDFHRAKSFFKAYTKDEFEARLKKSRSEAASGQVISHEQLLALASEKYGL